MTSRKPGWTVLVGAACSLATARAVATQTTGTIDVGVATVRYDGFLSSGAASLTPAVRWERPSGTLSARGTYLLFQSGNRSLDGLVAGSWLTAPARRWRGELVASAGASNYVRFATFWHAIAEARIHLLDANRGIWMGGSGGRTSFGGPSRPVARAALGAWARRGVVTLTVSAGRSFVGDTAYSDLESTAWMRRGRLEIDALIGARLWSHGGGHGVYGEATVARALGPSAALLISGGRYPTDPVRGTIAGRYLRAAVRFVGAAVRPLVPHNPTPAVPYAGANSGTGSAAARLAVRPDGGGVVRVGVHAPEASLVELAGDFTDWQPVVLTRTPGAGGMWEVLLPIASGVHRLDIRINGGAWIVPIGARRAADDFGGEVGIIVVP